MRLNPIYLSILFISCVNMGDSSYDQVEPSNNPTTVTYEAHIKTIMDVHCVECHSPTGRFGIQEDYDYSTYALTVANYTALKEETLDNKTMPPGTKARPTSREIFLLERWQSQGFIEK